MINLKNEHGTTISSHLDYFNRMDIINTPNLKTYLCQTVLFLDTNFLKYLERRMPYEWNCRLVL
ncbi:MAG: hypothetical protein ACUVUH_03285 [bacterium]